MYNVIDLVFFIKKNYKSIIIEFKNPDQIINLGGPWISDLYINGNEIENKIIAFVHDPKQIITILNDNQHIILDLEVKKGSLNDVFIAITGKEIRE